MMRKEEISQLIDIMKEDVVQENNDINTVVRYLINLGFLKGLLATVTPIPLTDYTVKI